MPAQQPEAHNEQRRGLAAAWHRWIKHVAGAPVWTSAALCLVALTLDIAAPRGVAAAIAYVPLAFCSLWFARPHAAYIFAGIATALAALALSVKASSDVVSWVVVLNCVLAVGAIWFVAMVIELSRQSGAGFIRDITKLKHAEKTMALLAAVVESSSEAVISKSLDGKIMSWNAGAERLFGYTAAEAIGRDAELIVPPDCADEERLIVAEIVEGRSIENFETVHVRKGGTRRHISLTVSPIRDADGAIVGTSKVAHDITDRKAAEAELLRHTLALERSNKDLDDFAYIASHDLREPLRGLSNNAKFLENDYTDKLDSNGVTRLRRMGYLTRRLDQLINDLLYFSRLGRQELAIQPTDMNAVIDDIASMMETTLKEQSVTIEIPRPLPTIVCDEPRVTEALRNLIANAVKYNDSSEKRIEIGCVGEMATARGIETQVFYVKDNGIGIEKEFHDEVFRIFKRLNDEDDAKKGTGVGLTFVRKIVERHGGRIWLDSSPGAGTTFYFTLTRDVVHAAA